MHARACFAFSAALLLSASATASAQNSPPARGSVSGRVTAEGKASPGVTLLLQSAAPASAREVVAKATTDADGNFSMTGIPPGRYSLTPVMPAFVAPNSAGYGRPERLLELSEGEASEVIDFALVRGGVITGRVTDADGRPVVAEQVRLVALDEAGNWRHVSLFTATIFETDDRGIYRIYGIPPGRYALAAGESHQSGKIRMGGKRGFYPRTFYPGVADEEQARLVEIKSGSEASDINIPLGRLVQTYDASGRVFDAKTGRPAANVMFGYIPLRDDGSPAETAGYGWRSDDSGEFKIGNLLPGTYAAFAASDGSSNFYSDPVHFEVLNDDVAGLEIKLSQGSSVSGVVTVEGTNDASALARLAGRPVEAVMQQPGFGSTGFSQSKINPDGTFRVNGLRPGTLRAALDSLRVAEGFAILRFERNGVEQRDGLAIVAGEHVTGVRIVLTYRPGGARQ